MCVCVCVDIKPHSGMSQGYVFDPLKENVCVGVLISSRWEHITCRLVKCCKLFDHNNACVDEGMRQGKR